MNSVEWGFYECNGGKQNKNICGREQKNKRDKTQIIFVYAKEETIQRAS